jgi:hypothetical protein
MSPGTTRDSDRKTAGTANRTAIDDKESGVENPAVADRGCVADPEPSATARRLRELAIWYRAFAEQASNPAVWEARLLTAEDLDAEATRIEQRHGNTERP